ncbi:MAG TPA: M20/M25/M40 family metallo-hydrolase, partial [Polyangiaceae bacterium]
MRRSLPFLLVLLLTACAAEQAAAPPPSPPAATAPPAALPAPAPAPPRATAPAAPSLPTDLQAAYRQLLSEMVSVDTSHGDESRVLEPIAALYRDAGVPVQILESSPGRGNLVARLKGSGAKKPLLLLAHVDVVPVEGQPWTVPPFAMTEKEGAAYGRGINDDKGMAAAIVVLTLELARTKAPLTRDVIVALTAGEETGGLAGVRWLTENHKDLLDAEIALNEGAGTLLTDDLAKPVSVNVQTSEKISHSFQLVAKGPGGHSSRPPTVGDPVVALSRALVKVGEHKFPATVSPETKMSFQNAIAVAEPQYVAALRHAVATAPRIAPADDAVLSKDPGYNSELRTTCVTTMLKGSPQNNVLPTSAEATINCRILPAETSAGTRAVLEKLIGDPSVTVADGLDFGEGPSSPF